MEPAPIANVKKILRVTGPSWEFMPVKIFCMIPDNTNKLDSPQRWNTDVLRQGRLGASIHWDGYTPTVVLQYKNWEYAGLWLHKCLLISWELADRSGKAHSYVYMPIPTHQFRYLSILRIVYQTNIRLLHPPLGDRHLSTYSLFNAPSRIWTRSLVFCIILVVL